MFILNLKNTPYCLLQLSVSPINALLSVALRGLIWLIVLFLFCFFGVHLTILAIIGWKHQQTDSKKHDDKNNGATENKNAENKAPTPTAQEPIYYIVERKRKPAKSNFGTPKQIRFK